MIMVTMCDLSAIMAIVAIMITFMTLASHSDALDPGHLADFEHHFDLKR